ncbi:MAG: tetratricopeptide repeat protein [Cyclobacteriaceae bacterium]|nr:tetratricopeptide repeat protein [Cyclobacteriaceae bacterium]
MIHNRLEQLLDILEEDPRDPFNLYAVAIEYQEINPDKSRQLFEKLLMDHAEYLPTYYHAAALFANLNDRERALRIYDEGIELATKQQNHHALRELMNARTSFIMED